MSGRSFTFAPYSDDCHNLHVEGIGASDNEYQPKRLRLVTPQGEVVLRAEFGCDGWEFSGTFPAGIDAFAEELTDDGWEAMTVRGGADVG